ncbi:solute carrier organic anion transporter family member 4A1-like [Amblyomma americanum]
MHTVHARSRSFWRVLAWSRPVKGAVVVDGVQVIQSMFNVASCIMVTSGSYHDGVGHRPVIPGIGTLVAPVGAMIFASPDFIAPQYRVLENGTANIGPERGPGKCSLSGRATNANTFKYFFMLSHAMHGVGSSAFFTLGVAYLDQNVPTGSASVYMAAKLKAVEVAQKQKQKQQWKQSRGTTDAQQLKAAEAPEPGDDAKEQEDAPSPQQEAPEPKDVQSPQTNAGSGQTPEVAERSFVNHVRRLVCNPTFVCLTLAAAAETMVASGLTGFATKIFIAMFGISSSQASGLIGAVPSACGGTLLGGYVITRKLNAKSPTIVRYCVILSLVPWFTLFVFMHSSDNNQSTLANRTSPPGARACICSSACLAMHFLCLAWCDMLVMPVLLVTTWLVLQQLLFRQRYTI